MHRIQWFDSRIREGKYPNSTQLAAQFEISKRQAQRDIEYLAYSLSAPLLYVAKYRGYCYANKTYALPLLYMTDEEKKMLKYLAYRYRQYNYDNADAVNRVAQLLDRFSADPELEADARRLPVFDAKPQLMHAFERLSYAIAQHHVVRLQYRDEAGERHLSIRPLKLTCQYNCDYVIAYCEDDGRQRMLRLDGIGSVDVTAARFEPIAPEAFEWGAGGAASGGSGPQRKPFTAQVKLAQPIAGDSWRGYRIRSADSAELVYTIEFYETESFLHHLLVSSWEELLSPKWLREQLDTLCRSMLKRLGGEEGGGAKR
ncbi:helix-turn-helix transcriptional regulator [Paenibacillus silvisoli]|uniref:helix-turn-helix transcriptional regulator n=1 Tax=Paenibacillus silvisoli TaxID=3110539 RepID=UPI00280492D8|nr:WYL domain-containing protein [Paenibacillus silvisoli]